jgi:hypothetical protein
VLCIHDLERRTLIGLAQRVIVVSDRTGAGSVADLTRLPPERRGPGRRRRPKARETMANSSTAS